MTLRIKLDKYFKADPQGRVRTCKGKTGASVIDGITTLSEI